MRCLFFFLFVFCSHAYAMFDGGPENLSDVDVLKIKAHTLEQQLLGLTEHTKYTQGWAQFCQHNPAYKAFFIQHYEKEMTPLVIVKKNLTNPIVAGIIANDTVLTVLDLSQKMPAPYDQHVLYSLDSAIDAIAEGDLLTNISFKKIFPAFCSALKTNKTLEILRFPPHLGTHFSRFLPLLLQGLETGNNSTLKTLSLSDNALGKDDGLKSVALFLKKNHCLKRLELRNTGITCHGRSAFFNALACNTHLKTLDISHNTFAHDNASEHTGLLSKARNLVHRVLHFRDNPTEELIVALKKNNTLKHLVMEGFFHSEEAKEQFRKRAHNPNIPTRRFSL